MGLLLVALLALACAAPYSRQPAPEAPLHHFDLSGFRRVLIAGIVSEETRGFNPNDETARILRMTLRSEAGLAHCPTHSRHFWRAAFFPLTAAAWPPVTR
jgi:hypothetical protein